MTSSNSQNRAHKKSQFAQGEHSKNNRTILIIAIVGLLVVSALYFFNGGKTSQTQASMASAVNGFVTVPLADLANGQAKFFTYVSSTNKSIRFFAIKSSDGVYRAAADACDVCFRDKMGYQQEGNDLVCRKCGRHFPSKDVNVVTGGCNPDGIPVTVQGDKLLIASSELEKRTELF